MNATVRRGACSRLTVRVRPLSCPPVISLRLWWWWWWCYLGAELRKRVSVSNFMILFPDITYGEEQWSNWPQPLSLSACVWERERARAQVSPSTIPRRRVALWHHNGPSGSVVVVTAAAFSDWRTLTSSRVPTDRKSTNHHVHRFSPSHSWHDNVLFLNGASGYCII